MKKTIISTALAALVLQSGASADIELNVTMGLTASYTEAALRERDENGALVQNGDTVYFNEWETYREPTFTYNIEEGSVIVTERFSNREFLQEFIVEGGIDSTIQGWAIKLRIPSGDSDIQPASQDESGDVLMYAVKGDQIEFIDFEIFSNASAEQYRYAYSFSYNESTDRSSERESGSARGLDEVFVAINFNDILLDFSAILGFNDTLRFFGTGEERFSVWIPSAINFSPVVGSGQETDYDYQYDEAPAVLQGRISANGGRLVNAR